ncbi:anti-sigma regulatory factor (Ser/Thr protein kinase) [Oxalobacteraceae bacterium GrIS 2.11]
MAKPSKLKELIRTVTSDVTRHPAELTRFYMDEYQISRVTAAKYIVQLETEGWIARSGPKTRPIFSPGYKRKISKLYKLRGLEEHVAWLNDFKQFFALSPNVQNIVSLGFTEMLNNAIDHSMGNEVFISAEQGETYFTLYISDDGVGIFKKIADALHLPDMRLALFELSKGKLTTDPSRHSGEGVFFTSRMFDTFMIVANDLTFNHDARHVDDLIVEVDKFSKKGTEVFMRIRLDSQRTAADIYAQFTKAPEDFDFSKTVVPMRLAQFGEEQLISRSQAKRLIARFDRFKTIILDFQGVEEVGQAFADEIFRVYALEHPDVELIPKGMSEQVERMWLRAVAPRM